LLLPPRIVLKPLPEGILAGHVLQKTLAKGAQLLHLVGGHLAALQLATKIKKAVNCFTGSVAIWRRNEWGWSHENLRLI
jgi:hypothetical protein